ncbi:MAG: hypothetical protein ACOX6H_03010 [Christensenellales bacterium]
MLPYCLFFTYWAVKNQSKINQTIQNTCFVEFEGKKIYASNKVVVK